MNRCSSWRQVGMAGWLGMVLVLLSCPGVARGQTGPTLVLITPGQGQSGISPSAPVVFVFSAAMNPELTEATFLNPLDPFKPPTTTSSWSADQKTLTCTPSPAFPANQMIVWTVYGEDPQGNALEGDNLSGFFTTGTGGGGQGTGTNAVTDFLVAPAHFYLQNSSAAPTLDPDLAYTFSASTILASNRTATNVTLKLPTNVTTNLTQNPFAPELFFLFDSTTNLNTHNATYPVGAYVFTVQAATSNQTVTLNLPSGVQPNAPRVANYGAAQSVNAQQPFTLSWDPFVGGTAADFIQVEVGAGFTTPDVFEVGALNGTATSIVIPAGTLSAGQAYDASILFVRGTWTTNQPAYHTFVGRMTTTQFKLVTRSGQVPTPITLTNAVAGPGTFSFEVMASPGQVLTVEASTNLQAGSWTTLLTTNSTTGTVRFTDLEAVGFPARFYRAGASN